MVFTGICRLLCSEAAGCYRLSVYPPVLKSSLSKTALASSFTPVRDLSLCPKENQ